MLFYQSSKFSQLQQTRLTNRSLCTISTIIYICFSKIVSNFKFIATNTPGYYVCSWVCDLWWDSSGIPCSLHLGRFCFGNASRAHYHNNSLIVCYFYHCSSEKAFSLLNVLFRFLWVCNTSVHSSMVRTACFSGHHEG